MTTLSPAPRQIKITRSVALPDFIRMARYKKVPELGPKVLFFSGGTALKSLSQSLIHYTHNSIHLITPFDSGGSSAKLRKAYHMLAVGDIRNRLMALADQSVQGNPDIYKLFAHRLPQEVDQKDLYHMLDKMVLGDDPLVDRISSPMRKIIRNHIKLFMSNMPDGFDLKGASIGNLILVGGYLNNDHHIDPVIFLFSKLVEARGIVRPIISKYLHLVAELENGEVIVEQHRLTGKETSPIKSPIRKLYLTQNLGTLEPVNVKIRMKIMELIQQAELICYPMGSFYTSLIANLLPKGVGQSISENPCPKIYIPNNGNDPEQIGLSLSRRVKILLEYLQKSCYENIAFHQLLNFVVIDNQNAQYPSSEIDEIKELGIGVIDYPLDNGNGNNHIDETTLISILLSII